MADIEQVVGAADKFQMSDFQAYFTGGFTADREQVVSARRFEISADEIVFRADYKQPARVGAGNRVKNHARFAFPYGAADKFFGVVPVRFIYMRRLRCYLKIPHLKSCLFGDSCLKRAQTEGVRHGGFENVVATNGYQKMQFPVILQNLYLRNARRFF